MRVFWDIIIRPFLQHMNARSVVEIGSEYGSNTQLLADFARETNSVIHTIDPLPRFDTDAWQQKYNGALVCHTDASLNVLPNLGAFDAVLIDGDHNWYTVYHELDMIADHAAAHETSPIIFLHDLGWPYGRRDMYYDINRIPEEFRQPHAKNGISAKGDLSEDGYNAHLDHALHEGGEKNGVATAVEDFLKERPEWESRTIDAYHGLGILFPKSLLQTHPRLEEFLDQLTLSDVMKKLIGIMEKDRIAHTLENFNEMISREKTLRMLHQSTIVQKEEIDLLKQRIGQIYGTISWRITQPIRKIGEWMKRR